MVCGETVVLGVGPAMLNPLVTAERWQEVGSCCMGSVFCCCEAGVDWWWMRSAADCCLCKEDKKNCGRVGVVGVDGGRHGAWESSLCMAM